MFYIYMGFPDGSVGRKSACNAEDRRADVSVNVPHRRDHKYKCPEANVYSTGRAAVIIVSLRRMGQSEPDTERGVLMERRGLLWARFI